MDKNREIKWITPKPQSDAVTALIEANTNPGLIKKKTLIRLSAVCKELKEGLEAIRQQGQPLESKIASVCIAEANRIASRK